MTAANYVIRLADTPQAVDAGAWNALLQAQAHSSPFMRHEYLSALHDSGSACAATGWAPRFFTLWHGAQLHAACVLYLKSHSYGEYVFDWAWADAYQQHGLDYYPKALLAAPFTPVSGSRLLAVDERARDLLLQALLQWCAAEKLSSLHLLFGTEADLQACAQAGLLLRSTVQFHWQNAAPGRAAVAQEAADGASENAAAQDASPGRDSVQPGLPFRDFEDFLASLSREKRKNIRQERRKVAAAGVRFRVCQGRAISTADWDFFYLCYERTYLEHGNAPYLTRDFFQRLADTQPEAWLLFVAERAGQAIASSLIAIDVCSTSDSSQFPLKNPPQAAYGRYWGAIERVDCLHFEACYYQPIEWCIAHGVQRFEGGAQGEHKMARALLPVTTRSAHWLAHPAFADAVERFLVREGSGVAAYLESLEQRLPFK